MNETSIHRVDTRHKYLANGKIQFVAVGRKVDADTATRVGQPAYWYVQREITGTITVEPHGEFGWVNDLFVIEAERRQGIAWQLLQSAIAECRRQGYIGAAAGIDQQNVASIALFERAGFVRSMDYPDAPVSVYSLPFETETK